MHEKIVCWQWVASNSTHPDQSRTSHQTTVKGRNMWYKTSKKGKPSHSWHWRWFWSRCVCLWCQLVSLKSVNGRNEHNCEWRTHLPQNCRHGERFFMKQNRRLSILVTYKNKTYKRPVRFFEWAAIFDPERFVLNDIGLDCSEVLFIALHFLLQRIAVLYEDRFQPPPNSSIRSL